MDKRSVIKKVRNLVKTRGVQLTKLGEVLGSRGAQQAKIDRANRFIRGYQKSVSLDEIKRLAKFFGKPESYFLEPAGSLLREGKNSYGQFLLSKIDKLSASEVEESLEEIRKQYPKIFKGVKLAELDDKVKRVILKIFYRKVE